MTSKSAKKRSCKQHKYAYSFEIPAGVEHYGAKLNKEVENYKRTKVRYIANDNGGVTVVVNSQTNLELKVVVRKCIEHYNKVLGIFSGIKRVMEDSSP